MIKINLFISISLLFLSFAYAGSRSSPALDTKIIENLTGAKGEFDQESNVFKVFAPPTGLKVSAMGVKLTPALGLMSWASFKSLGADVEVMGDMVLLEHQVNFVMKEALDHGLNVTALHNHFLWDSPKIMFMHVEGEGHAKDLAIAIGKIFEKIKKTTNGTIWKTSLPIINPDKSTLNSRNIEEILGKKGVLKNCVYKLVWESITQLHGHEMKASMGVNTWAAFAGTDKEAVMLGDIAMTEDQVQNVLKTLLKHNIFIVSLHQHMMGENPRIMFVHYMGRGPASELAKALKETLGQANLFSKNEPQESLTTIMEKVQ